MNRKETKDRKEKEEKAAQYPNAGNKQSAVE
ncbi:hypothetical protein C5S42_04250 [Candidatus Methanomarinus sp.]|nr:hypothetical protein C5S42_04250 [ANME-2 cluster archaeon]